MDQAEIRKYNQILASEGIRGFIKAMLNTPEYAENFGEDTVPYRRYPTLPAANFPNTERLYNRLTKQNRDLVVPSFVPAKSTIPVTDMPLMADAVATQASREAALAASVGRATQSATLELPTVQPATRLYRWSADMDADQAEEVITAIYRQVMMAYDGEIPTAWRLPQAEQALRHGNLTVRGFVAELLASEAYQQRFVDTYPQSKLVEIMARQILGRNLTQGEETQQYQAMADAQGRLAVAQAMLSSAEYQRYFGEQGVPYRR
jgi:phycobilisome core-membrane linker protein